MPELRSSKLKPKGAWSIDEIRLGFLEYMKSYGRYPSAHEIDAYDFLPSSRSLQRSFGGLVAVRKLLFPEEISDYTKGEYRSKVAADTIKRSFDYEDEFYDRLIEHFKPVAVHEHKIMRPGRISSDFFLFLDEENGVCLDLFYAKDLFSAAGVINYKVRRYSQLRCQTVFVLLSDGSIDQQKVDALVNTRKVSLPSHIKIYCEEYFWSDFIPTIHKLTDYAR